MTGPGVVRVRQRLSGLARGAVDPAGARTLALGAALVALSVALVLPYWGEHPPPGAPQLTWWQLTALFVLAEVAVFRVKIRSEAHSFSLSEVPLLLGLVFASPTVLVLSRLAGGVAALVGVERQRPGKLGLNAAVFLAESALAVTVFRALAPAPTAVDPATWASGWAAVGLSGVMAAVAVWLVIRWHGGAARLRAMTVFAVVTAVGNASLATVAAVLVLRTPWALPALVVVIAIVLVTYRQYGKLTRRFLALELLVPFTRLTGEGVRPVELMERILEQARDLLRAQDAWILLERPGGPPALVGVTGRPAPAIPPDQVRDRLALGRDTVAVPRGTRDPAQRELLAALGVRDLLAAPLTGRGDGAADVILVANQLGYASSFDAEDARVLTALAAQAGIALENGRLVARLHDQVQAREHEALHDALTGLPNRTLFSRELRAAVDRFGSDCRCAVLLMDLDQFKEVNDTLGHHTGDLLLQEVADRLRATVDDRGLVSRLGGDEFAVLVTGLSGVEEAFRLAREVFTAVTEPFQLPAVMLAVGASIGVAVRPEHGEDPATLLQRADIAMYSAKRAQDPVAVYSPGEDWNSELRLRLAGEVRGALAAEELGLHFQPIVRTGGGQVEMVEALARWDHPELGELSPEVFIPIAERTGMIGPLTLYVLDRALRQCRQWQFRGLDIRVAVNLSTQVMLDTEWPERVLFLLGRHEVAADRLALEITETTMMSDLVRTVPAMRRLTEAGVQVGIDDFGTGYSSLAYLQGLPVSELKIDKSFVASITSDQARRNIVRSVVDLAHSLGLSTVAEGVEDQPTLDFLTEIGCDLVQGHWLSRPLPAEQLTPELEAGLSGPGAVGRPARIRLPDPVPTRSG